MSDTYLPRIVKDVVELRKQNHLDPIGPGETYETLYDWYQWLISLGMVETVYKDDELMGFMECVRLNDVPKDQYHVPFDYSTVTTAPVLCVVNVVAKNKETFLKLRENAYKKHTFDPKNPYVFWHRDNEARDRFRVYRRTR